MNHLLRLRPLLSSLVLLVACGGSSKSGLTTATGGAGGSAGTGKSGGGSTNGGTAGVSSSSGGTTSQAGGASASGGSTTTSGGAAMGGSGGALTGMESVLERNNHPSRDGLFVQPALTKAAVAKMGKDTGFTATFKGDVWASPLYLAGGAGGGEYFAVTTSNDVFAFDAASGKQVWTKNLGPSPTSNGVNCGSIHPLGIVSTPVIDGAARTIYVVGAIAPSATTLTSIARHELHAFNADTGDERPGFPVDLSKATAGSLTFNAPASNQRSALSLVNGIVYVAFGGHVGDCGTYHGWITAVDTKNPTSMSSWATLGVGEGIWAPGGLASDGVGIFAITGNSTNGASSRSASDSEQILRLTGMATFTRSNANLYYPTSWRTMDSNDADFGANNPIVLSVPGSTPEKLVIAITKDGHFHLLDASNLGGSDGTTPLADVNVATGSMAIHTVPAAYTSAQGVHIVFSTDSGGTCPAGGPTGTVVMSVLVPPGAPPVPKVAWCAALGSSSGGGGRGTSIAAPIATSSDGTNDAVVWFVSNAKLTAVDGDTGAVLYTSTDTCPVKQWTSPIATGGHVVAVGTAASGADNQVCSWSPH